MFAYHHIVYIYLSYGRTVWRKRVEKECLRLLILQNKSLLHKYFELYQQIYANIFLKTCIVKITNIYT